MSTKAYDAILKYFRFRSTRDNLPWSSPRGTRGTLAAMLGELEFNKCVEVGSRAGEYAKVLCENNPNIDLVCVDPWAAYGALDQSRQDEYYQAAIRNLAPYNARLLRKPSLEGVKDFAPKSLDFVYIDGAHDFDNAVQDICQWAPKVKSGGILAGHDYYHFFRSGVVEAVDAYTHCHRINPWFITQEQHPSWFWVVA